jgi:dihydroorotate dehydrogenase
MSRILLYFLQRLSAEWAHRVGMFLLRFSQIGIRFRLSRAKPFHPVAISVGAISGIKLRNRFGLAAGFDKNAEAFVALSKFGFGFIEVGTVTPLAQKGNQKPRLWRVPPSSLVNAMGFNNCGLLRFRRNLTRLRPYAECPIFANVGKGKDTPNEEAISDYARAMDLLKDYVDGFVINVSSPNTPGLRDLQTIAFLESICRFAPTGLPVFVKLSPDMEDVSMNELLDAINQSNPFAGVVLTNTSIKLAARFPGLKGGLSGPPLLERALKCVSAARERLSEKKLIIGVGGVSDPSDYKEMRQAGADLVEVYTGLVYKGVDWVREMAKVAET